MIRVAVIGVSHWHSREYIRALQACGVKIVAVSDADTAVSRQWGESLDCPAYAGDEALLCAVRPDLIYAFAKHAEMTALASRLVEVGLPFVMEKPMGLRWEKLVSVVERAQAKSVWAGVDFVARTQALVRHLLELRQSGELGQVTAYSYRLLAGDPNRYAEWGVPWMLDPAQAGAGALCNFGGHVLDLFLRLTGEPIQDLDCWLSNRLHRLDIPDYAQLRARTPAGAVGDMVVGYVCPGAAYDRYFALGTDRLWVSSPFLGSGTIRWRDGRVTEIAATPEGEDWALTYTRETLRRFQVGEPPVAPIADMLPVLRAINEAEAISKGS